MQQIIAFILSFFYLFLTPWNSFAQPNIIPETRKAPVSGPLQEDCFGVWPTEAMILGEAPWWFSESYVRKLYDQKGERSGGPYTDSLLVLYRGKLIYAFYADGYDAQTCFPQYSVTKSVISALIGIAIGEGLIQGLDDRIADYFPEAEISPEQSGKRDITVEHLLTMTSGLVGDPLFSEAGFWDAAGADPNPGKFLLERIPLQYNPGTKFSYDSIAIHLLALLLNRVLEQSVLDYAKEKLFEPLGMDSVRWDAWGSVVWGGSGIFMTAEDMARFGYLYLNYGRWEDRQIIPGDWVARSPSRAKVPGGYGLTFWNKDEFPLYLTNAYEAGGAGGQLISVYPFADTVIVRTGHWD